MDWLARIANTYLRPLPSSEFWVALHELRSGLLRRELMKLYEKPQFLRERHLMECLKIVDCWVDEAIYRGWLSDKW